jgi:ferredoxin--NADP+ reductase
MTASAEKFTRQTLLEVKEWCPKLFSLRCTRDAGFRFRAGQWARLGLYRPSGCIVWRAYSIVSAPHDEVLEFFSIVVPDGEFSSELKRLGPGDQLLIERQPYGFLTLDRFADGEDLWLLASGTGIAPFLSILQDLEVWQRFRRIILACSVRSHEELAYSELIAGLADCEWLEGVRDKFVYLPVVTREALPGCLNARLTELLDSGELERAAGLTLDAARSRVMLCGNPEMVEDLRTRLQARGLQLSLTRRPGAVAVENYW